MLDLTVTIEPHASVPNTFVAHFEGAFDGHIKEPITELEEMIMGEEGHNFIFDFAKLTFLNSYAIGQLVSWHNHLLNLNGQIIIASPAKNVEDIFNIVGISNMFKIFSDLDTAAASLQG